MTSQNQNSYPVSGNSFVPNLVQSGDTPAVGRRVARNAANLVERTMTQELTLQGQAMVANTALTETMSLVSYATNIAQVVPEAEPYLRHILEQYALSAGEKVRHF